MECKHCWHEGKWYEDEIKLCCKCGRRECHRFEVSISRFEPYRTTIDKTCKDNFNKKVEQD